MMDILQKKNIVKKTLENVLLVIGNEDSDEVKGDGTLPIHWNTQILINVSSLFTLHLKTKGRTENAVFSQKTKKKKKDKCNK